MTALVAALGAAGALLALTLLQRHHRARAEARAAALAERVEALEGALAAAPDGHFIWFHGAGPDVGEDGCSRRLAVLLGLLRGTDTPWADVAGGFGGAGVERLQDAVMELRESGEGFEIELEHRDTGRRILAVGIRAVRDDGTPLADVVWMRDVTEGAAAVEGLTAETAALRNERDRLSAALDGLEFPVWLRDENLSLVYANRAYMRAVDAGHRDVVVDEQRELASTTTARRLRALAAAARAAGAWRQEAVPIVMNGSRRLMEVSEGPVALPGGPPQDQPRRFTAGAAYDVTSREDLAKRLAREDAAHADVLERLSTAIAIFDADARLRFFNVSFSELWGLDPEWLSQGPNYGEVLEILRENRQLPEVADYPAFKEGELARFRHQLNPSEDLLHLPDGSTLRRVIAPPPHGRSIVHVRGCDGPPGLGA